MAVRRVVAVSPCRGWQVAHAQRMRDAPSSYEVPLRALHKGARLRYDELSRMCNGNLFSLQFLIDQLRTVAGATDADADAEPADPATAAAAEVTEVAGVDAAADAAVAGATLEEKDSAGTSSKASSSKASSSKASGGSRASGGSKAGSNRSGKEDGPPTAARAKGGAPPADREGPMEGPPSKRLRSSPRSGPAEPPAQVPPSSRLRSSARVAAK